MKLNGSGQKVGAAIILKVMSGNTVSFSLNASHTLQGGTTNSASLKDVLYSLANGKVASTGSGKGSLADFLCVKFKCWLNSMNKILVVDDDADFLYTVKTGLTDHGFIVQTILSQDEIYKSILIFEPTVILLDIYLEGADGRNICRGLKNHFRTKEIPIIFCSGDHKLKHEYHLSLAEDFIEKPFNTKVLADLLNVYCKKPPSIAEETM
jgi:two-component system response regulator VicR/two-component system sensor histidine kinase/response regulator